jgi:UDP-N-acetylmuramyl pentapeptide phosphotransferase/UDP-N-acetylglucosamine-1-phosphate transferase
MQLHPTEEWQESWVNAPAGSRYETSGLYYSPQLPVIGFPLAAALVAAVGWMDDRHSLPAFVRLLLYLLISAGFIVTVGAFSSLEIPLLGDLPLAGFAAALLALVWLVGFLNIFNFMDGIDGLAGSQALLASLFWLLLFLLEGQFGLALLAGLLAAASLGFLFHNRPPARIFMGDVGSAFLGFALAAVPLMAYSQTGNGRMPVVGVLFVAPFVLDGALTILRRALRHENVFEAHRSHLYQRLVIAGQSHRQVTRQYRLLMLLGGVCGVIYYAGSPEEMALALLVMVGAFAMYAAHVSRVQAQKELTFSK